MYRGRDSLTGVNVPFKLRLKTKKIIVSLHFKKKASFLIKYSRHFFGWDSLTGVNVPFKLRLKTKKIIVSLHFKKKASFLFEARSRLTIFLVCCTLGGNRTHTILQSLDFESSASTNSATKASFLSSPEKKYAKYFFFGDANIIFLLKIIIFF